METLFNSLGVSKFDVKRYRRTNDSQSRIMLTRKVDIQRFGSFLYPDGWDGIGFKRKFQKYREIIGEQNESIS